ncbi:citrate synthase-lysine N-methyltransferase CSKMT, mitochondrial isoform X2 [Eleginops maclovinus]|uniref:citrate synthase-lysine N-methyltransferase CSKMT, mitochondrial isoform X2 n=1 Tax=Eleginops maclovinus TaxID=56733 RepID=UPI00308092E8
MSPLAKSLTMSGRRIVAAWVRHHSVTSTPAYEMQETDPDWAPSVRLGHCKVKVSTCGRLDGRVRRKKRKLPDTVEENQEPPEIEVIIDDTATEDQTPECDFCKVRQEEINRLQEENMRLRSELEKKGLGEKFLKDANSRNLTPHRTSMFCHASDLIQNMDKKATWDRFYAENRNRTTTFKNFEWFFGFEAIRDLIMPFLQTKSHRDSLLHVLDMGCGTSALGPCIYRHSYLPVRVTCADISPIAVRQMLQHVQANAIQPHNVSSQLEFVELDCTELQTHYLCSSVDLIIDKGTTDALLRSKEGKGKAGLMLKQCLKVLRSSGSLLQFSDEDPDARLLWLETEAQEPGVMSSDVRVQEVGELRGMTYYCYHVTPRPVV